MFKNIPSSKYKKPFKTLIPIQLFDRDENCQLTLFSNPLISTLFLANSHMSVGVSFQTCAAMLYSSIKGSYQIRVVLIILVNIENIDLNIMLKKSKCVRLWLEWKQNREGMKRIKGESLM